jgi:hypothetical protein
VAAEHLSGHGLQGWLQTAILSGKGPSAADVGPELGTQLLCRLGDEAADALLAPGCRDNASVRREKLADARGGGWGNSAGWGGTEQADQQRHRQ